MNSIPIEPVSVYTPDGEKTATQFKVVGVDYKGGDAGASAISIMLDVDGSQVTGFAVYATQEQCDGWFDDDAFSRVLAQNAKLTPIKPDVADAKVILEATKADVADAKVILEATKADVADAKVILEATKPDVADAKVILEATKAELQKQIDAV